MGCDRQKRRDTEVGALAEPVATEPNPTPFGLQ